MKYEMSFHYESVSSLNHRIVLIVLEFSFMIIHNNLRNNIMRIISCLLLQTLLEISKYGFVNKHDLLN